MNASDLVAARTRLGLTQDAFAAELGLTPHVYAACEAGTAKLSKREAQLVVFRVACAERDEALLRNGFPPCPWIEQWEREAPSKDAKPRIRLEYLERAQVHTAACPTCQAREQFVREHFPNMPNPPVTEWVRIVGAVTNWIEARPKWMRPALYGAAILAAMTSVRAVLLLLGAIREPHLVLLALGAVIGASLAGAAGGLVYSAVGRPLRRIPGVGPYLAGIVTVAGYLGSIGVLLTLVGEDVIRGDVNASLFAFGFTTLLFGLVVGHQFFRRKTQEP